MGFGYLSKKMEIKEEVEKTLTQFQDLRYVEELSWWGSYETSMFSIGLECKSCNSTIRLYGNCNKEQIFSEFEITAKIGDGYSSWYFDIKYGMKEVPKVLEYIEKFKTFINEFLKEFNNKGVKE